VTKAKISEYSATAGDNTDVNGTNIAEGCPPSGINDAIREVMAALKRFETGADGDSVTVGGNLVVSGSTTANTLSTNLITEKTSASGVTIDGVLLKDNGVVTGAGTVSAPVYSTTGDTNTGIFFPAADQVAVATNGVERVNLGNSATVFNDGGADVDFRVEGDTDANLLFVDAGADSVGIGSAEISGFYGSSSVNTKTLIAYNSSSTSVDTAPKGLVIRNDNTTTSNLSQLVFATKNTNGSPVAVSSIYSINDARGVGFNTGSLGFGTVGGSGVIAERMRIDSSGRAFFATTSTTPVTSSVYGIVLNADSAGNYLAGAIQASANGTSALLINRGTDDGQLVGFYQAGTVEGNISVSGNTVSYNAFCGGHWTQLQEGRGYNPDIPRGTVMSSIGEMAVWKSVEWTETIEHPAIEAVEAVEAVLDEDGNVIEPAVEAVEGKEAWTETSNKRDAYLGSLDIGATFEEDGFTKTVVDDGNERLPKVKISDVVGDKAVYGVFQTYDEVEDMLISSLGAFVVRIAAGVTVEVGDLLESNGDGCAKVQDDDIIRSKTIGKVTSTVATDTYNDGSYTVPCVLYCG